MCFITTLITGKQNDRERDRDPQGTPTTGHQVSTWFGFRVRANLRHELMSAFDLRRASPIRRAIPKRYGTGCRFRAVLHTIIYTVQ